MRYLRIALVLVPLVLAACGLSDQQKADYAQVQRSGVSSAIYDKMVHGDDLSLFDIKALARAGVSDGVTLRYLRSQASTYYLTAEDVTGLRKAGVSPSIIDYMLQTPQYYGGYYPPGYGFGFEYGYGYPYYGYPFYPYGSFYRGYGYYGHRHWH